MRSSSQLRSAVVNFVIFTVVCVLATFGLMAIFAQLRFSDDRTYKAVFSDVNGLEVDNFVRIAGVEVGKIKSISITRDAHAVVEFSADRSVTLTQGTEAAIRWANPIGDRYLALLEGAGTTQILDPGGTIAMDRTTPALDLDTLLGGFRPLFRALNPDQVNALSMQLIQAFQGEGATIGSFLSQAASVTNTLADRDQLIGQVIGNLEAVLGSLGQNTDQFAKSVDSLAELMKSLAASKSEISNAVAYTNASSATLGDLISQIRPSFKETVAQSDRATSIVLADHEYFDELLNTLPESYRALARLGVQGDYITEYLCDLFLKVNGKGGQPVYIKLLAQDTGRCAPR